MTWRGEFARESERELNRIDRQQARRILKYLSDRIPPPKIHVGLEPLYNIIYPVFEKYRIGNYRVICEIQDETVTVLVVRIGHRRQVYQR